MKIHEYSQVDGLAATTKLAQDILKAIDTPKSLAISLILRYDLSALNQITCYPSDYPDSRILATTVQFSDDYQAYNLLRKLDGLVDSDLLLSTTYRKFVDAEHLCARTNIEFAQWERRKVSYPSDVECVLFYAQQKIASILAKSRLFDHDCGFGPGASSSCRGLKTHVLYKLAKRPDCSDKLRPYLNSYLSKCTSYLDACTGQDSDGPYSLIQQPNVFWNTLRTVPKDSRSLRTISIEPHGSIFYQKMIGSWIRSGLKSIGLDLDTRQDVNGRLARRGSIDDSFSTIDFESASDSISFKLVEFLLPNYAFRQLNAARSTHTKLPDGRLLPLQKFSSMGNGFTFELETAIFYSLLYGCYRHLGLPAHTNDSPDTNLSVFGDDVICLSSVTKLFLKVSHYCGFKANSNKTFVNGPFRESCGYDYFNGIQISPFRLKKLIRTPFDLIDAANRLRSRTMIGIFSDPRYKNAWLNLVHRLPPNLVTYCPFGGSNTSLWVSLFDIKYTTFYKNSNLIIRTFRVLPIRVSESFPGRTIYAAALYSAGSELSFNTRSSPIHYKATRMCVNHLDRHHGLWLISTK